MKELLFMTGNASKFYEASKICRTYDIQLIQQEVDIDEIQHHVPLKIAEAKVRSVYDKLHKPIVVNDSSWNIPALNGFPGGYMKDVSEWLTTKDFQVLMTAKTDKRIILNEVVAYYDGESLNIFTHQRTGYFLEEPKGQSPPSFARLVRMDGDDTTISEIFDKGNWNVDSKDDYKHWHDFGFWYSSVK